MIRSVKIRLFPTPAQEEVMRQSVGVRRFAYNWGLARSIELYKQGTNWNKINVRTEFNQYKKQFEWMSNVSAKVAGNAFEDLDVAMKMFFNKQSSFPRFKSKHNSRQSFYVRYDAIYFTDGKVNMEKIGKVKCRTNQVIPCLPKYIRPSCSFDGRYWYLSFGFEVDPTPKELTGETIGIDLGIKDLAIVSNLEKPVPNINKSKEVKRLKKKLRRLQRSVSRKYEMNKDGDKFVKTKNIIKKEAEIKLVYRRLTNIRQNHIHQATAKIVRTKPSKVVMEDLNVSGIMKNRHLARALAEQKLFEFRRQMEYKCEFHGIEFVLANRWFPSSKTCSCCGNVKKELKLKDRTYKCTACGFKIDRDRNACVNLSRYQSV